MMPLYHSVFVPVSAAGRHAIRLSLSAPSAADSPIQVGLVRRLSYQPESRTTTTGRGDE